MRECLVRMMVRGQRIQMSHLGTGGNGESRIGKGGNEGWEEGVPRGGEQTRRRKMMLHAVS